MNKKRAVIFLITIIIILVAFITFTSIYLFKQNSDNYNDTLISYPVKEPIVSNTIVTPVTTKLEYEFENYPISFEYEEEVSLKEISGNVLLNYKDNTMKIIPNQRGIGFEEPAPEETVEPILFKGQDLIINNKVINKTKLYFTDTGVNSYLISVPYSNTSERGYSIMINYQFPSGNIDQETINMFDEIVKTFRVG